MAISEGFVSGHNVNAHEINPGVVYKHANVTVTALATKHAMESYGYRFNRIACGPRSWLRP